MGLAVEDFAPLIVVQVPVAFALGDQIYRDFVPMVSDNVPARVVVADIYVQNVTGRRLYNDVRIGAPS